MWGGTLEATTLKVKQWEEGGLCAWVGGCQGALRAGAPQGAALLLLPLTLPLPTSAPRYRLTLSPPRCAAAVKGLAQLYNELGLKLMDLRDYDQVRPNPDLAITTINLF